MADWTPEDSRAALREGWDIFDTGGAEGHDVYEIQFLQEPGLLDLDYDEPKFENDADVWVHVRNNAWADRPESRLHQRALAFLKENAPDEFKRVIAWPDTPTTDSTTN